MKKRLCIMVFAGIVVFLVFLTNVQSKFLTSAKQMRELAISEQMLLLDNNISIKLPILEQELGKAGYFCMQNISEINAHSAVKCTYLNAKGNPLTAVFQNPYDINMPVSELPITTIYVNDNENIEMGMCKVGADKAQINLPGNWKGNIFQSITESYSLNIVFDENDKVSSFFCSYLGNGWWNLSGG